MENTALQLSDLKVSNLPELQGWKEKQEQLVSENPYVEITDNKTYEVACKSRTALLKGRTELEKQDKLIASKLTAFRKDVKTETDTLIAITLPSEEKQQAEVKRYEGIKEVERQERERIEQQRIDTIKAKIDSIESESLAIIQKMTFQNIIPDTAAIGSICQQDFDFEEYDILFEQTLSRIETSIKDKIDDLNEREEQRIAREQAEEENRKLKAKQDLQAKRLNEIMPYVAFGEAVDLTNLSDIEESAYSEILASKKALFEADAKEKREKQEQLDAENLERENKAKADKEKIFEIRKARLIEVGLIYSDISQGFMYENPMYEDTMFLWHSNIQITEVNAIDFEDILSFCKSRIEGYKSDAEESLKQKAIDLELSKADAERLKKENKERVKRLAKDKKTLTVYIEEIQFDTVVSRLENEESKVLFDALKVKLENFKTELLTELEKL